MTLREELIKLAFSFLGITLLGGALTAFWTSRQKRREIEEMELKSFYEHYGQLLTAWRLWKTVKLKKISLQVEATRYELLKQASEAESALEGMLLKLASERFLSKNAQSRLGRFRQGCQTVRQSIREDKEVPWDSSQVGSYLDFKEGASFFASLLRKRYWTLPTSQKLAMKAVREITHNKHEPQGVVILVIGPSGVGKSDYGRHAEKTLPGCRFFDLDSLVGKRSGTPASELLRKIGDDAFLHRCQQEVEDLLRSCTEGVAVVAVGAGALQSGEAHTWLSRYPGHTIEVVAASEEVYRRGGPRNNDRTLEGFKKVEYSEYRQRLYDIAKHQCCVTGLSAEKARNHFTDLIRKLAMQSHGETAA